MVLVACTCLILIPCWVDAGFIEQPLNLNTYILNDLGVVDLNDDDYLDIFTSNCFSIQSLVLGNGLGGFGQNVLSDWKLDHDPEYPGLENTTTSPPLESPGLYLFWQNEKLIIRTYALDEDASVSGTITLDSPLTIEKTRSFEVMAAETHLPEGATRTTIEFKVTGQGKLSILPDFVAIPVTVHLNEGFPLNHVYVGAKRIPASSNDSILRLTDRFGHAWADYNGDGLIDVFIVRGGLKGEIETFPYPFDDELMSNQGDYFRNNIAQSGIVKGTGRGRQVAWVDFNRDGRLDLYVGNYESANQLFQQKEDGTFIEVAHEFRLDITYNGPFAWLDCDNDGDMDLLMVKQNYFFLYVNQSGTFEAKTLGPNTGGVFGKLIICDFDSDGDLDVFRASSSGNTLLRNTGATFELVDPAAVGLPKASLTGNFVDYDINGIPDLHLPPDGLYRQLNNHAFVKVPQLGKVIPADALQARCNWFDANNDGTRDFLAAFRTNSDNYQWRLRFYYNNYFSNHWLQIKLLGTAGNRQAIGARAYVKTGGRTQLQAIGAAEGSHYSQGHYRLYFGLGMHEMADLVKIIWPDGTVTKMDNVPADQLLVISHPG